MFRCKGAFSGSERQSDASIASLNRRSESTAFKKPLGRTKRSRTKELFVLNVAAISRGCGGSLFMIYFCIVEIKALSEPMKGTFTPSSLPNLRCTECVLCYVVLFVISPFKTADTLTLAENSY